MPVPENEIVKMLLCEYAAAKADDFFRCFSTERVCFYPAVSQTGVGRPLVGNPNAEIGMQAAETTLQEAVVKNPVQEHVSLVLGIKRIPMPD